MTLKRILGLFFIGLLLLFFLLCLALYLFLPDYLETKLIPKLANNAGISPFSCQIRRLGFAGVDVGRIQMGKGVSVDSVQIDYQLKGLLHRKIQRVSLIGAKVRLTVSDGNISIDGIHFPNQAEATASSKIKIPSEKQPSGTTVSLDRFSIKNSAAVCRWNGKIFRIPVELDVVLIDSNKGIYRYLLNTRLRGHLVKAAGEIDTTDGNASLALDGKCIRVESFSDILPVIDENNIKGMADIQARANVDLQFWKTSGLSISLALHQPEAQFNDKVLRSAVTASAPLPAVIKISTDDLAAWRFSVSNASVGLLWGEFFANAEGQISMEKDLLKIDGELHAQFKTQLNGDQDGTSIPGLVIQEALPIRWQFNGQKKKSMPLEINVESKNETISEKTTSWEATWNDVNIRCLPPRFHASASDGAGGLSYQFGLEIPRLELTKGRNSLNCSSVRLSGETKRSEKAGSEGFFVSVAAVNGQIETEVAIGRLPNINATGLVKDCETFCLDGNLSFSRGAIDIPKENIRLKGLSANIPIQWPYLKEPSSGYFRVRSITWNKKKLGNIGGKVFPKKGQLGFKGAYHSQLLKDMVVHVSGETDLFTDDMKTQLKIVLPSYQIGPDLALDQFTPDMVDISLSGKVMVESDITVSKYAKSGTLSGIFQNGQIKDYGRNLTLGGVSVNVAMFDLFNVKSAPKQLLKIDSLSYGDIYASDMTAEFQIESLKSFFIEQSRFKWCDGYIQTQPLRITPGINDYDLTFYCDRLKLACLLKQFGAASATGGGTVNGRVPVKISNKKISFEDGFLYSTPGGGGHIQLTDTEMLTAGIPPNTPQYVQIDIAKEALKDYEYEWVKVHLTTEKDNLDLKLQFDGKPGDLLPFVYKKELGRFIRVDATGKGSRFQGIGLDVNFKLPLDDLLQYKDIMDQSK